MLKLAHIAVAAVALSGFVFSAPVAADDVKDWKRSVAKLIVKKQTYPRSALSREIEGRAKVRLVVAKDGTITSHEIVQPTGENVLDREIPKLVKRLSPLPALPASKDDMSLVIPLSWSLD